MKNFNELLLSTGLTCALLLFSSSGSLSGFDKLNQTFDGGWKSGNIEFICESPDSEYELVVQDGKARILVNGVLQPPHSIRYSPEIVVYLSGGKVKGTAYAVHLGKGEFSYQTYGPKFMEFGEEVFLKCK